MWTTASVTSHFGKRAHNTHYCKRTHTTAHAPTLLHAPTLYPHYSTRTHTTAHGYLTFPRRYHLHRLKDSTLLSVPRKPVVNVFAQWREAQALEAQLTKQLTLMEMRQRERDAVRTLCGACSVVYCVLCVYKVCFLSSQLPEDKGNTEAEKLRNRIQELQTKLDRAFTAAKQLEKDVANSKETNRKLAEECRVPRHPRICG